MILKCSYGTYFSQVVITSYFIYQNNESWSEAHSLAFFSKSLCARFVYAYSGSTGLQPCNTIFSFWAFDAFNEGPSLTLLFFSKLKSTFIKYSLFQNFNSCWILRSSSKYISVLINDKCNRSICLGRGLSVRFETLCWRSYYHVNFLKQVAMLQCL